MKYYDFLPYCGYTGWWAGKELLPESVNVGRYLLVGEDYVGCNVACLERNVVTIIFYGGRSLDKDFGVRNF